MIIEYTKILRKKLRLNQVQKKLDIWYVGGRSKTASLRDCANLISCDRNCQTIPQQLCRFFEYPLTDGAPLLFVVLFFIINHLLSCFLGCCFVFFCSAAAHLLNCYSVTAQELCFCLDYGSIAVFGLTLAVSFQYMTCPVQCVGFTEGTALHSFTFLNA